MNKKLSLAAAIYFAVLLLISAPASLLDLAVRRISEDHVSLANCQGTVWQGSAVPVLSPDKSYPLATLSWQIKPQAWLFGQFKFLISWDASTTPMELTIEGKRLVLEHVMISMPAELIGDLSPFLKPAELGGNLRIESPQLEFKNGQLQGRVTAHWSQASSSMSAINPFGDYQIGIEAVNDEIHGVLSTQSGALRLDGLGSWSPAKHFKFNGTARAAEQGNLNELLHHLGPETTPGVYQISL